MGRGLGRALFDVGCEWMREADYHSVFWWVNAANARAIAFYERMGAARIPDSLRAFDAGGVSIDEYAYGMQL
jgi:RimJ/RimL family protein N-acetyltransferase